MASRLLKDLEPITRTLVVELLGAMSNLGHPMFSTCTFRSSEEQDALYGAGRTSSGRILTNARGGQSAHNFRMAADLAFTHGLYEGPWDLLGQEARRVGLVWGGDWKIQDRDHVERKDWRKFIV